MFILENSITLPRCLNFDDSVTFSWNIRYSFISTKVFFYHRFEHILFCSVLFCCLLLEYLLSVCWISIFRPSYLSSSLLAFIYLSFSSAFLSVFWRLFFTLSTLFLVCGFLLLITLIYLLILQWYYFCHQFLSSTASSPFHLIVMSYHLIFDLF